MMTLAILPRLLVALLGLALLSSCNRNDLAEPPVALGDFKLGLNIVVADNMQKVPISRDASVEEWETAVKKAIDDRFGRYDGTRFYNIGIAVDGFALAPPGIPVVAAPKSVLVITANIWDDASQTRLNAEGKQMTIFENLDGATVIGTGLTSNKRQQMAALSYNAAKAVENWLLENPQWFAPGGPVPDPPVEPGAAKKPGPAPTVAPAPAAAVPVATQTVPTAAQTTAPGTDTVVPALVEPVAPAAAADPAAGN